MATAAMKSIKTKPPTVAVLITQMATIRDERKALDKQSDDLKAQYDELQTQLIAQLKAQGLDRGATSDYSATISTAENFSVIDWDKFMAYVAKNKAFHLVQRRVSAPAVREVGQLKGAIPPGLEQFTQETINLRSL